MAKGYRTQEQETDCEVAKQQNLLMEAAIHVSNGMPRNTAINHVREIDWLRSEAERCNEVIRDEHGFVVGYINSELDPPSSAGKESQIRAIYLELCALEGVNP